MLKKPFCLCTRLIAVSITAVMPEAATGVANPNIVSAPLVTCTNTTPYNIGLDKGAGTSDTVTNRLMTGPSSATVTYGLFQDSGHATNWGNTIGTDTVTGTGNGSAQTLSVYGHIAPQTTPQPGAYADTVNVTVTF